MIKGLGIDLVKIERIDKILKRWNKRFLKRIFTDNEIAYCQAKTRASEHLAARFAAKEAALKMLGIGLRGISWQELEVRNNDQGKPELLLFGKAKRIAEAKGIKVVHLSISHEREYVIVQVIGEG